MLALDGIAVRAAACEIVATEPRRALAIVHGDDAGVRPYLVREIRRELARLAREAERWSRVA